jgi:general secretion pathway protein J
MNRHQRGFTLLELVIALAIFAMVGLAGAGLYESLTRTHVHVDQHEYALRSLQRAMAVMERDIMQVADDRGGSSVGLQQGQLSFVRGNWRNPLDQSRSERQFVSYRLVDGVLWRHSSSPEMEGIQKVALLKNVRDLKWRLHAPKNGWIEESPLGAGQRSKHANAVELTLSVGRFEQIRRVILLPEGE